MDNFEALHPRAGGTGPGRTQFANKEYLAPALTLGQDPAQPDGLIVAASALDPDISEADLPQITAALDRLRSAGVTGTVTSAGNGSWKSCDITLERGSTTAGIALSPSGISVYRSDENRDSVDNGHEGFMDTFHLSTSEIDDAAVRECVDSVFEASRIADAWARGSLRSCSGVTFHMPRTGGDSRGVPGTVSVDINLGFMEATVICAPNGAASVQMAGEPVSARIGAAIIADAEEAGGGKSGDLLTSLGYCRDAA